jgi:hypothetical protein
VPLRLDDSFIEQDFGSILCECDGVPLDELLRYEVDACSVTTLEHEGRWRVLESGRPLPVPSAPI